MAAMLGECATVTHLTYDHQRPHMQATIYNDQHMADYIAVVANLALSDSPELAKVRDSTAAACICYY